MSHSRPKSLRSILSAPKIETSGRHRHRKYAIQVKSDKSDWLKIQNEYPVHTQKLGSPRGLDWHRPNRSRALGTRMTMSCLMS